MISSLEDIIPISDLIHGASKIIKRLKKNKRPIIITQNGRASIVCMDVKEYQRRFRDEVLTHAIKEAEKDFEEGKYKNWDDFEKELRKM